MGFLVVRAEAQWKSDHGHAEVVCREAIIATPRHREVLLGQRKIVLELDVRGVANLRDVKLAIAEVVIGLGPDVLP